jgi:hypothetical protein
MRRFLIASFTIASLALFVGCSNKSQSSMETSKSQSSMGQDDCAMCPGVQHAKADGTCPSCGMQLKNK